ncbi:glycosyltransferase [Streptomyces sp. ISL-99]|uniref:glycosyltransferase n=1 Tax=Streptomyces sp. ISL-99 TaxID=2819193 RepID=UPI001BEB95EA|nr:glycosyltransferase [Streptomyces sp. ISL-99]MBT2527117.1 glycosyltransferase [Streptomyces sp. ISL-99]
MTTPDISVIIGAYNAMPYLSRTLASVVGQTIGHDRMEIITVNDGSTDTTGEELERFAADYPGLFQVVHQENSGGPSAPRNVGLDRAKGRYVFFLDADDYLGEETLERMLAAAETNRTDVVLGKMVGVNGRGAPASMFVRNQPRTDVFNSRVYWALNPLKLFRRDFVERHGLRFPTGYKVCEDQLFTALAYLRADGISVVADYECLFIVRRDDGQNITVTTHGAGQRIRALRMMIDLVEENVPPGPDRDVLMHRHLTIDMYHALLHLERETDRAVQEKHLGELREMLTGSYPDSLRTRVNAITRLRSELVLRGLLDELLVLERADKAHRAAGTSPEILVEDGRAYARLPFFRDPEAGIPDDCYDITRELQARHRLDSVSLEGTRLTLTGHAYLRRVPGLRPGAELVLRERDSKAEHRVPAQPRAVDGLGADEDGGAYSYTGAGFSVTADLSTVAGGERLPRGLWDVFVALDTDGVTREIRFGHQRLPEVDARPATHVVGRGDDTMAVALYFTKPYSNLTVDVGENKHLVSDKLRVDDVAWSKTDAATLEITGSWKLATLPLDALSVRLGNEDGGFTDFPVTRRGDKGFTAYVPLSGLAAGTWTASLLLAGAGGASWLVTVPARRGMAAGRWRRFGLPWYAVPAPGSERFTVRVDRVRVGKALAGRLKR